jgi:hypothetical protein
MRNEADREISLYIGDDSGVKSCEKEDAFTNLYTLFFVTGEDDIARFDSRRYNKFESLTGTKQCGLSLHEIC